MAREAIFDKYFACEEWEKVFDAKTYEFKRMRDYSGFSFDELANLPISLFLQIKRDSWIHSMKQSPESAEVLKNIYRLGRKEADKNLSRG
ncbi:MULTISPECIES: hypothetical protein [unclassified Gemella]|uniref:hypothetical protein n=1 Tax=unclassified Gemella TaxID=2624949 RepID=UPI001C03FAD2|nr:MULTISPECIES: hypothetical protein [unclassified Gemella]MBU0279213.1 hypothetical protein [Gemella sp. zg-1178]QWQ39318.1 hypothetical protein KMP11_03045 [Gemella sp. zg-570]